jgi:hypothetical protein
MVVKERDESDDAKRAIDAKWEAGELARLRHVWVWRKS